MIKVKKRKGLVEKCLILTSVQKNFSKFCSQSHLEIILARACLKCKHTKKTKSADSTTLSIFNEMNRKLTLHWNFSFVTWRAF
jgi:hypothetical protein